MTTRKQVAYLWGLYWRRETDPDYEERAFLYCRNAITPAEIQKALDAKNFNLNEENCDQHRGDREWHARQIATFVNVLRSGQELAPITLNGDDTVSDGCHRLYTHWYLDRDGTAFIEVTY